MPGARCTRGLVCNSVDRGAHEHTGQRRHPTFPAQWFYGLYRALPGRAGLFVTVAGGIASANLTPASGRQDHTTSPYASAPFVKGTSASTASHPASCDDRETPLVPGRDEIDILLIWVSRQDNFGKSEID